MEEEVKIQLIRNATMKITYAGKTTLADPMLSPPCKRNVTAAMIADQYTTGYNEGRSVA